MVASYMLKTLLPVAVLTSYAAAETCAGGEWDVIVVGKLEYLHLTFGNETDIS